MVKPGVMDEEPIFYVNDEVGCALSHTDTPNTKVAPFIHIETADFKDYDKAQTFSVLFFTKDVKKETYLNRDYLNGVTE